MDDEINVGDVVRQTEDGPLMLVVSVSVTPSGTVMVGCVPLEAPESSSVTLPSGLLVSQH